MLEYVALGDFQTAVGFLLASPPDRSQRYYRDALCVLGMAFACGLQAGGAATAAAAAGAAAGAAGAADEAAARSLFVQAAKVITANAASVGDTLLGVPLLCSTGAGPEGGARWLLLLCRAAATCPSPGSLCKATAVPALEPSKPRAFLACLQRASREDPPPPPPTLACRPARRRRQPAAGLRALALRIGAGSPLSEVIAGAKEGLSG